MCGKIVLNVAGREGWMVGADCRFSSFPCLYFFIYALTFSVKPVAGGQNRRPVSSNWALGGQKCDVYANIKSSSHCAV